MFDWLTAKRALPIVKDPKNLAEWPVQADAILQRVADIRAAEPKPRPLVPVADDDIRGKARFLAECTIDRMYSQVLDGGLPPDALELLRVLKAAGIADMEMGGAKPERKVDLSGLSPEELAVLDKVILAQESED